MRKRLLPGIIAIFFSLLCPGCAPKEKPHPINYSVRIPAATIVHESKDNPLPQISVTVASIYSARESYEHFQELFSTVGKKCSVSINILYSKNYRETLRFFETDSVELGIVSPSLYVLGKRSHCMRLLAVPEIGGKSTFHACIIVPRESIYKRFADLRNRKFAFTDELSLAGYFYPQSRTPAETAFWQTTLFAGSHDNAIDLVNRGIVDGASVADHVLDYITKHTPEKTASVRIIDTSEAFGLPPIVIGNRIPDAMAVSLKNAFLSLSSDSTGSALLRSINIDHFVSARESLYQSAEKMVPKNAVR